MKDQLDLFNQMKLSTVYQKEVVKDISIRKFKNESQNEIILTLFQNNPSRAFTAWEVKNICNFELITSVRRAMTTLKNHGFIVKLDEKKMEIQGENNHCYKLRSS